jgi:FkbM family methyltransferase
MRRRVMESLVCSATSRWRDNALVRSGAYRVGEALGRHGRLLLGTTPGRSPIWLSARDHQHRHLYFFREYEPDITALFHRFIRPGWTVFDVGANAGYFTVLSHELGANVHAFEPHPSVCALLEQTAALQPKRLGSIRIVRSACSDLGGVMPLYLAEPESTGMSSLGKPTGQAVDVQTLTLDDYSQRFNATPDFLKIDVEGHEREVLKGAKQLLREKRPIVIVETESTDVLNLLIGLDYDAWRIRRDGSLVAHGGTLDLAANGYENVCFLPS